MKTIADKTVKNWRWWLIVPLMVPAAMVVFLIDTASALVNVAGVILCRVSEIIAIGKMSSPKFLVAIKNWAQGNGGA